MGKRRLPTDRGKSHPKVTDAKIAQAFRETRGLVALTARSLGLSTRAVYYRLEASAALREALDDARKVQIDVAQGKLFNAIDQGEAWAVCFYLKTQAKHLGYVERHQVEGDLHLSGDREAEAPDVRTLLDELRSDPDFVAYARERAKARVTGHLGHARRPSRPIKRPQAS